MCESNAYMRKPDGEEDLLLEMVDQVYHQGDHLVLEDIFGRKKTVRAKIVEMALIDHRIILKEEINGERKCAGISG